MKETICVIGLGYVGLPLAVAFAKKYKVVGVDINRHRVEELVTLKDSTCEVSEEELASVANSISYTYSIEDAIDCNIYIVTVPTPIDSKNHPDLFPLISASKMVGEVVNVGDVVIYESTVYPGVTEDICVPEIEKVSKLEYNVDFYCGYSPERINPGDCDHHVTTIKKVTSGSTPEIAQKVDRLYKSIIIAGTHLASSIKVAEASKVIENTQRDVNIALINELALIFNQMGISTDEVIEAASTKWNFIKLKPGLVGGHCIGVDPYYLTYKAEELGYTPNLILASRQINNGMSKYISEQTIKQLIKFGNAVKYASVLILGATFKENCPDFRNTKVFDIIDELSAFDVDVDIYDPYIRPEIEKEYSKYAFISEPSYRGIEYDAIIVAVAHNEFVALDRAIFEKLSKYSPIIMDVKGLYDWSTWKL